MLPPEITSVGDYSLHVLPAAHASKKCKRGKRIVEFAKKYFSEGFMGCDDPLESVLFSAMMKMWKDEKDHPSDKENCLIGQVVRASGPGQG